MDNIDIIWQLCSRFRPKVQLHFLLTGYKNREYNIHVIGKLQSFSCSPNMFTQSACDVPACWICEK